MLTCGCGGMVDTLASGASDRKIMEVQVLSSAPKNLGKTISVNFRDVLSFDVGIMSFFRGN
jgi:hypothetical protein